jgi:hypothetical protein
MLGNPESVIAKRLCAARDGHSSRERIFGNVSGGKRALIEQAEAIGHWARSTELK